MISLPDACSYPWAMMIVDRDTAVANRTMINPRRLNYFTSWAFFAKDFIFPSFSFVNTFGQRRFALLRLRNWSFSRYHYFAIISLVRKLLNPDYWRVYSGFWVESVCHSSGPLWALSLVQPIDSDLWHLLRGVTLIALTDRVFLKMVLIIHRVATFMLNFWGLFIALRKVSLVHFLG